MNRLMESIRTHVTDWGELFFLTVAGILIGFAVAVFEFIFGTGLLLIQGWRLQVPWWTWLAMPFAGLLVVGLFLRFGGLARKGMNLIFEVSQGEPERLPKRMVSLTMLGTWLSHLAGASVGREGVAVQIGAAVSWQFGHFFHKYADIPNIRTIFLVTGMAAGFSGLFGTPFAAFFFALEVLVAGTLKYRAMAPALCASFSAAWLSSRLGMQPAHYAVRFLVPFDIGRCWLPLLVLGILFGAVGGLFAFALRRGHALGSRLFPDPWKRMLVLGSALALLMLLTGGRYAGGGSNLIGAPFSGQPVFACDFLLKAALTILSLSAGFVGGEVTPLFSIGACLGAVAAPLAGLDPMLGAALGFAAVFGAGTNTFLAPVFIGMEVFGFAWFPWFFCVCAIGYLVNRNQSIYSLQKRAGLHDV